MQSKKLILRDELAIDRTRLANERTFLAYFRTFIVIMSSGVAIIKLDILEDLIILGYIFLVIAPIMLLIGVLRFFYVKKHIRKFYNFPDE
ncbi:DUF202 domain-containing protein [Abyssalbus ytuae]|uniref:DUF202 domain-containing protein n=1 Tax=Abyssalbus ytuae TaxID=2926907 RepID=A0A9E6ZKV2_9FLAO|nr:DUF202 domain-containing protein [Abyssalbus ytuae]UOB17609.1 DUF202 domain-containing protein [Abyssalbus ytuae]